MLEGGKIELRVELMRTKCAKGESVVVGEGMRISPSTARADLMLRPVNRVATEQ